MLLVFFDCEDGTLAFSERLGADGVPSGELDPPDELEPPGDVEPPAEPGDPLADPAFGEPCPAAKLDVSDDVLPGRA
jgi:hypothetical protein